MQDIKQLIDSATAKTGANQTDLAAALGVTTGRLSDYKHGRRGCPLHHQAQLAEMAGMDAKEWVWAQVCRQLGRTLAALAIVTAAVFSAPGAPVVAGSTGAR